MKDFIGDKTGTHTTHSSCTDNGICCECTHHDCKSMNKQKKKETVFRYICGCNKLFITKFEFDKHVKEHNSTPPQKQEWVKSFNEKFGNRLTYPCKQVYNDCPERVAELAGELKSFIKSLLSQSQLAMVEKIKMLYQIPFPEFNDIGRKTFKDYQDDNYNQALEDVLSLLK